MNSFKIANSINKIDDDLILETDETVENKKAPKKPLYLKYAAAAAALVCVLGVGTVIGKPQVPKGHGVIPDVVDFAPGSPLPETPVIKMSDIHFNDSLGGSLVSYDMDFSIFDSVLLDTTGITEYFGWDLVPRYIPEGLNPAEYNNRTHIYSDKKSGEVVFDRTKLKFAEYFDEFGEEDSSKDFWMSKRVELVAAKAGSLNLCIVIDISNKAIASSINGVDVYFADFLDNYIAEFELDGIRYRITTSNLEAEEIVKIVSSIICDSFALDLAE